PDATCNVVQAQDHIPGRGERQVNSEDGSSGGCGCWGGKCRLASRCGLCRLERLRGRGLGLRRPLPWPAQECRGRGSVLDAAARQRLAERRDGGGADARAGQVDLLEARQLCEMGEPLVADPGVAELERLEPGHSLEMDEAGVADLGVLEI